jgi:hypothetical protein
MTETYDRIQNGRNITEAEQQWESAIDFSPRSNTYKLFRALLSVSERIDNDLEEIYEQTHINSATGSELDQFGELVDVDRETGEGDDRYRARIKAAFRASTIGTTFDQFTEFAATVLNTNLSNLNFATQYKADPGTVRVGASPEVYDQLNITEQDAKELLGRGVPAGHEVIILEGGTFRLKADGDTDDPSKGLTADDITSGGTLAEDLA